MARRGVEEILVDPSEPPPVWKPGRYAEGARVTFRGRTYIARHKTEIRPGLAGAWWLDEGVNLDG